MASTVVVKAQDFKALKGLGGLLGGSWVVISGVISRVTRLMTLIRVLITLLITTHEPPSRGIAPTPQESESAAFKPEILQKTQYKS